MTVLQSLRRSWCATAPPAPLLATAAHQKARDPEAFGRPTGGELFQMLVIHIGRIHSPSSVAQLAATRSKEPTPWAAGARFSAHDVSVAATMHCWASCDVDRARLLQLKPEFSKLPLPLGGAMLEPMSPRSRYGRFFQHFRPILPRAGSEANAVPLTPVNPATTSLSSGLGVSHPVQ